MVPRKAPISAESLLSLYHWAISLAGCVASFGLPWTKKLMNSITMNATPSSGVNHSRLLFPFIPYLRSFAFPLRDAREYPSTGGQIGFAPDGAGVDGDRDGRGRPARHDSDPRAPAQPRR